MSGENPQVPQDGPGAEPLTPDANEAAAGPAAGAVPAAESVARTAEAVAPSTETPPAESTVPAPAAAAPAAAATTPVVSVARRRGLVVVAAVGRLLRFAFVVALFAVGSSLGYMRYLSSNVITVGPEADAATAGNQPAPVIREFIAAVGTNDADRIRSVVPTEPYKLFTSEMQRWEFQEVTSVETLATYEDGARTATAFVMLGHDTSNNPIAMNIVVETQDGEIVGFK